MPGNVLQRVVSTIACIGREPKDSEELCLQKSLLVFSSLMMATLAIVWGCIYWSFGERVAAAIPLSYAALSYLSIAYFAGTCRYGFFRFTQLLFPLLLPFLLMIALGGFVPGSAVVVWALTSPLGALMFAGRREAIRWFLAYLGLVVLSALLEPWGRSANSLPTALRTVFFVMNIGFTSTVAFVLLQYFVVQKENALRLLNIEQQKSENLLLNILPREVADALKDEPRTIADGYDEVSVLFADVVDFTPMSAQMTPVQVVDLLNDVFSYFDSLTERYGLEKIKTIGDCYMVAAGVPRPRKDHAHVLARMGLEVRDYTAQHVFRGKSITFRIGINSGPVVAGVIGRSKFIYDLWGDAVNTASRMESHGVGGQVQITAATYEILKDDFVCLPRGQVWVKGKGLMEVWHIAGENGVPA